MPKSFIVLEEQEQLLLERICLDQDADEALEFVLNHIVPKLKKRINCLAGELKRHE